MLQTDTQSKPAAYDAIWRDTLAQQFGMPSDVPTGSLLRTLAALKPGGLLLELGTGTGMATSWLLDGMDADARLITVDNDPLPLSVAQAHLGHDPRLTIQLAPGETVIDSLPPGTVDLIFADAWPGKYNHLDEALALLKPGGLFIVDDMLPQPNWPAGHDRKADALVTRLEAMPGLQLTKLNWSTGLILAVKRAG